MLNTVKLLRERDVQVESIADGMDPSTTSSRLMPNNIVARRAKYEQELITKRVNAGITGAWMGEPGSAGLCQILKWLPTRSNSSPNSGRDGRVDRAIGVHSFTPTTNVKVPATKKARNPSAKGSSAASASA